MANKITIDIEVNGKMQKATVSAKKLRNALDQTSKSARTTDRNIKGASQQSANATKNFSKMAQGMTGTLVPAYATIAANVFAISAAFNFLKSAGDLKALQEGQVAYAAGTGIAIKNLTNTIVDATNAQISFQDAAQASAIGLAAGLSQTQLKSLGTAAKDVSLVLGRDVTDSFNRLIRGVTKAEPELLDELGIILRLETATENYAIALGKSAKDLTQFEKSQAIANEVLTQTEQKYSSMLTSQDELANSFAQLGKSFENEFLKPLKTGIADVLTPIVDFLSQNLTALAAVLTLVALPITRAIIPSLDDWAKTSVKAAATASRGYKKAQKEVTRLKVAQQELKMSQADPNVAAQGALKGVVSKSTGISKFQKGDFGALSKKEINGLLRAAENGKGAVTQMGAQMKAQYIAALRAIKTESKTTFGSVKVTLKSVGTQWKIITTGMVVAWKKATVQFKLLAVKAAKGIDFAFKAMGWIGWILLGIDLITMAYDSLVGFFQTEEQKERKIFEEKEKERIDGITESLKALNEELQSINERSQQKTGLAGGTQLANFIGNIDLIQLGQALEAGSVAALETVKQVSVAANKSGVGSMGIAASGLQNVVQSLFDDTYKGGLSREDQIKQVLQILSAMGEVANVSKELEQSLKNQAETQAKFLADLTPRTQYDNMIAQYEQTILLAQKNKVDMNEDELAQFTQGEQLLKSMRDLRRQELGMVNDSMQAEINRVEALRNASKETAAVMKAKSAQEKLEDEITKLQSRQTLYAQGNLDISSAQSEAERLRLLLLEQQVLTAAEKVRLTEIEAGLVDRINASQLAAARNRVTGATQKGQLGVFAAATGRQLNVDQSQTRLSNLNIDRSRFVQQQTGLDPEGDRFKELQQRIDLQDKAIEAEQAHLDLAKKNLTDVGRIGLGVGKALNDSMQSAFDGLIQGTMTAKEAFASMATSMLQSIAKVIAELLTAKLLTAALGGTSFGNFLNIPAGKTGGVFSNGGKVSGYATGGVAKGPGSGYPAILHGTEAVVPLPNGKSIPVDMKGAGQNNNVTVNVAIDGQGNARQDKQADSNEGANLGSAIAAAVQKELQNQKRAGGMLNPMGVS